MKYLLKNDNFYYIGQILREYDTHGNYIQNVEITNIVVHKNKKDKKKQYVTVNFRKCDKKSIRWSVNADMLGDCYRI